MKIVRLIVFALLGLVLIYDHMRLSEMDRWLSATVGTRTVEGGGLAPLNRADALAVLVNQGLRKETP